MNLVHDELRCGRLLLAHIISGSSVRTPLLPVDAMPTPATMKAEIGIAGGPKETIKDFVVDIDAYLPIAVTVPAKPETGKDCTAIVLDAGKRDRVQFLLIHVTQGQYLTQNCPKGGPALSLQWAGPDAESWKPDNGEIPLDAPFLLIGPSLAMLPEKLDTLLVKNHANTNLDLRILIGKTMKPRERSPELKMPGKNP